MNGPEHYAEAERLLRSCQLLPAIETDAAIYPAVEDDEDGHPIHTTTNALAAAQVHATLALAATYSTSIQSDPDTDEPVALHSDPGWEAIHGFASVRSDGSYVR